MGQQGATTSIDPVVMLNAAQSVEAQRAIIENCLNSIITDANSLRSVWEGDSADAYRATIAKLEENSPKVVSILSEYVLDLNEIASSFMTGEQKRKAQNEALPGDVFGS